jgi:murein DD-endopeptidase MepM/ murein hydrolase activator NlpD
VTSLAAGPRDTGLRSWRIAGRSVNAELRDAVTAATLRRVIDGASTLTVTVSDPHRRLLRSGLWEQRNTCTYGGLLFEYVQCAVGDGDLTLKFEDARVADMRRAKGRSAAATARAGTITRAGFVQRLAVAASPGLRVHTAPGARALVPLSRGSEDDPDETTWAATRRILEEIGWRAVSRHDGLFLAPDDWLLRRVPAVHLRERTGAVIGWITGDFDERKVTAEASLTVHAGSWALPPGDPVRLDGMGPLSGLWLVKEIERSAFSTQAQVTLSRRSPSLPEPKPEPREDLPASSPAGVQAGPARPGGSVQTGAVSKRGLSWPLTGRISSGFGQRSGRLHAGIDIPVRIGTPVRAAADGTVLHAGTAGGYGIAVYLEHDAGLVTRYAHLSKVAVRRGQRVRRGDVIAASGNTGRSSGPHLHFEIRPGNRPANPLDYLP